MFKLKLPLPTYQKKGKFRLLSFNIYRNLHYQVLSKAKREYTQIVIAALTKKQKKTCLPEGLVISYVVFFKNRRRRDLDNFLPPISKFVQDALVECGIIKDDCVPVILGVDSRFGGYGENKVIVKIEREGGD